MPLVPRPWRTVFPDRGTLAVAVLGGGEHALRSSGPPAWRSRSGRPRHHAAHTAGLAAHRAHVVLAEAHRLAGVGEHHHVVLTVGDRHADQVIALVEADRDDAGLARVGESVSGVFLTVPGVAMKMK